MFPSDQEPCRVAQQASCNRKGKDSRETKLSRMTQRTGCEQEKNPRNRHSQLVGKDCEEEYGIGGEKNIVIHV